MVDARGAALEECGDNDDAKLACDGFKQLRSRAGNWLC